MARRTKRRAKLNWIVIMLVSVVAALCILTSLEDKHQLGLGLPRVELPSLGFLDDLLESSRQGQSGGSSGYMDNALSVSGPVEGDGVTVHMLDMGQADSFLIRAPGMDVLIDAGENNQGNQVIKYLQDEGVDRLGLVVGTHPHSDHIGGLDTVILGMPVEKILLPEVPEAITPTTNTYADLLVAVEEKELDVYIAEPGLQFDLGGGAMLTVLGPAGALGDLNNISVAVKLTYGGTSMLLTGDAESQAELALVERGGLRADVLKLGHHGSNTSSIEAFLDAVSPRIALISCGLDNSYGHPHREVMERLQERDIQVYRTDLNGAVTVLLDGARIYISTEK